MIRAGLMGVAGLTLPDVLRLRAASAAKPPDTAVIYILQEGGASQFETWDPKPDAPADIRGDFNTVQTSVPGIRFCELLPRQAALMDKLTLLRSVHHPSTQHSSSVHLIKTGYYCSAPAEQNEMPSIGSYVSRIRGSIKPGLPPYVTMRGARYGQAMWNGSGHDPFEVEPEAKESGSHGLANLTLVGGVTDERLKDRRSLLADFDRARRIRDLRGVAESMDGHANRAFDMVTGFAARNAFDLDLEPTTVRERYGRDPMGQRMLLARRLIERGVTFVTVGTINWDHHGDLTRDLNLYGPRFDQALAALIEDLHLRGLAKRVLVVVMGEFGRTPRLSVLGNSKPGRDHWGDAMSVLLFGGNLSGGQVVGASDKIGSRPTRSPCRLEQVLTFMYGHLGIDPALTFNDNAGRPRSLLDVREPIPELS